MKNAVTNNQVRDRDSINKDDYNKLSKKQRLLLATCHITNKLKEKLNVSSINDI